MRQLYRTHALAQADPIASHDTLSHVSVVVISHVVVIVMTHLHGVSTSPHGAAALRQRRKGGPKVVDLQT